MKKIDSHIYIPRRGDIIWIDLNPVRGHEQAGRRPALVISNKDFNLTTNLLLIVPITSKAKGYAIEVPVTGAVIHGVLLSSGVRSVDWRERSITFIETAPPRVVRTIQAMIIAFVTSEE